MGCLIANYGTADGGGIRGYSTLLILQQLMTLIDEIEQRCDQATHGASLAIDHGNRNGRRPKHQVSDLPLRPHHYFDYFVGTSTGGSVPFCTFPKPLQMTVL